MRSTGKKRDTNQPAMVKALRAVGISVAITHTLGEGFPDLVVGLHGETLLVEVKMPGGSVTDDEQKFRYYWQGNYMIAYAPGEVVRELHYLNPNITKGSFKIEMQEKIVTANAIYNAEMLKITQPQPKRAYTRKARKTA